MQKSNTTPFFSIVIPTYNRKDLLLRNLLSLQNQTFRDFEVIVSDDGSYDGSFDLVHNHKFNFDINYIYNENWGGPAKPRNIGIKSAKGEWICFCDSDDYWFENKLEIVFNKIRTDNFNCNVLYYHSLLKSNYKKNKLFSFPNKVNLNSLLSLGNSIYLSSVCVSKNILHKVNGFSENEEYIGVEDYDLYIRLAFENVSFINVSRHFLGIYTIEHNSLSSNVLTQINKVDNLLRNHINLFDDDQKHILGSKIDRLIDYMLGDYYYSLNDFKRAKTYFYKIIFFRPFSFLFLIKSSIKYIKSSF